MRFIRFCQLLVLLAIIFFFACKKEENFAGRITFVNALIDSPATPILTFKADSLAIASDIAYGSLITNPNVPSGTFTFSLFSGTTPQLSFLTSLQAGETHTWVMYDSAKRGTLYVCKDAIPAAPAIGECYVRIFDLVDSTSGLLLANGTQPLDTNRVYLNQLRFSFADFKSSSTGPAFTLTDTFSNLSIRRDSLHNIASLNQPLRSGKVYSLFLIGSIKDTFPNRIHKPNFILQTHN